MKMDFQQAGRYSKIMKVPTQVPAIGYTTLMMNMGLPTLPYNELIQVQAGNYNLQIVFNKLSASEVCVTLAKKIYMMRAKNIPVSF